MSLIGSVSHAQQPLQVQQLSPIKEAASSGKTKSTTPDSPRTAQGNVVEVMNKSLGDRKIDVAHLLSKSGLHTALRTSTVSSTIVGLLFSISPKLVLTGDQSERTAIDLAAKYQKANAEGADAKTKLTILKELNQHLEKAQANHSQGSSGPLMEGLVEFVKLESAGIIHQEKSAGVATFDRTQLNNVQTSEKAFSAEDAQLAMDFEKLEAADSGAARILGRAIELDARLKPFAAAAVQNPALARVAEKLVAIDTADPVEYPNVLRRALDQLERTNTIDTALQKEIDQALVSGTIERNAAFGQLNQGGLLHEGTAWTTKTAENAANLLIDGSGKVDRELIAELRDQLKTHTARQPHGPHADFLEAMLTKLESSAGLRGEIEKVKEPKSQTGTAAEMVRSTLGLPQGHEVTEVDARRATLSALLADLRQNDVGSCFGTANAILVHNHRPEKFVKDVADLMENGHLTRAKGAGTVDVPVSDRMSTDALSIEINLNDTGELIASHGYYLENNTAIPLHDLPTFSAALKAIGIPDNQIGPRLTAAAEKIGNPLTPEALLRQIAMEEANIHPDMLAAREQLEVLSGEIRRLSADLSRLDTELTDLKTQGVASSVIQGKKQEIAGLEKDLSTKIAEYEATREVAMRRVAIGPQVKEVGLSKFDAKLRAASDAYLAQQDNRLLRSWEYTVSAFAEQGIAASLKDSTKRRLFGSWTMDDGTELRGLDARFLELFPGSDLDTSDLRDALLNKVFELVEQRMQMRYDASVASAQVAADGNSSRGAFTVHDSTGSPNPLEWARADSPESFVRMVSGLIKEAGVEIAESLPADNEILASAVDALAEYAVGDEFLESITRGLTFDLTGVALPEDPIDLGSVEKAPWKTVSGGDFSMVQANYFERVDPTQASGTYLASIATTTNPPVNGRNLLEWMLGHLQTMGPDIAAGVDGDPRAYGIPVANLGVHTFLLMPGHTDLRGAWRPGVSTANWLNANLDTPGSQVTNRGISIEKFDEVNAKFDGNIADSGNDWGGLVTTLDDCREELEKEGSPVSPKNLRSKLEAKLHGDVELEAKLALLDQALVNTLETPVITFADSNWGDGDSHVHYAVVVNPGTGKAEMWMKPTKGDLSPMDQHQWLGCNWQMPTDPRDFGEA